jgi:pimeloyl-ACP methyl ester carboxylesterase
VSWFDLPRDGVALRGRDTGAGLPVVFQHGLGGSEAQVAEVFPDGTGLRRLTLDCRGQGGSTLGNPKDLSIETFANDVLAFADARGVGRFVAGGISMGAAIALRLAVRHPERVAGLVLARPAWLWDAAPPNMAPYAEVAALLEGGRPTAALAAFDASETAARLAEEAPDNLASLRGFFAQAAPDDMAALLGAIARDGPGVDEAQARRIAVPTLVIGHGRDAAHPLPLARRLAEVVPGAALVEITAKADDRARYLSDFRSALADFLETIRLPEGTSCA